MIRMGMRLVNPDGTLTHAIDDPAVMRNALAGPDAMLADASPEMAMYLRGAMRTPNPGSRVASERVEARAGAAYDDLMGALRGGRAEQSVEGAMDAVRTGSAGARRSAYDAAYSSPIDYASEQGAKLLDDISPRLPGKAISYANDLMRLKGERSAQIMAQIADDGSVTFTRPPDVRQWDYIKQALDQLAESGDGAGALGGQTRLGSAYQGLAREVRDAVADLVPEYRTALNTASDAITERNAVQFGADLLSPGATTHAAMEEITGATVAQKEAMRVGVLGQMDEVLGNVRAAASDQNIDARQAMTAFKALSSPNAQKKMEALFGDQWPGIKQQFDRAGRALGLRANTSANSATAANLFFDRTVQDAVKPGSLRSGRPMEAARNFIGGLTGASPDAVTRLSSEVKAELADLLTRSNASQSLGAITNALAANPTNPNAGGAVFNALAGAGFTALPSGVQTGINLLGLRQ